MQNDLGWHAVSRFTSLVIDGSDPHNAHKKKLFVPTLGALLAYAVFALASRLFGAPLA